MDKKRILYVDDEPENLRVFKIMFQEEYDISTVSSADEGLKVLETIIPDLIITDERMPKMTGVQFLKRVKQLFPDIPPHRIIISGYTETNDIKEAFDKYNLRLFVSKPYLPDVLKSQIDNMLNVA